MFTPSDKDREHQVVHIHHDACRQESPPSIEEKRSTPKPLQPGNLIALVGTPIKGKPSSRRG